MVCAATTNPGGHSEGYCYPNHCVTVVTSVPGAISGLSYLCHGSSSGDIFFILEPLTGLFTLVFVTVFVFCSEIPMWLPFSPIGFWPLGFTPPQPSGVYPWQTYVPSDAVLWSMSGGPLSSCSCTALSKGCLMLLTHLSSCHSISMVEHTTLGVQQRVAQSQHFPYMVWRGLPSGWFHSMTWYTPIYGGH